MVCRSTIFVFAYPSSIFRDSISAFSGVKLVTFWVFLGFLALALALGGGGGGGGANGRAEGSREEAGVAETDVEEEAATVVIAWEVVSSVVEEENVDRRVVEADPVTILERVEAVVTVGGMSKEGVTVGDEDIEEVEGAAEGLAGS